MYTFYTPNQSCKLLLCFYGETILEHDMFKLKQLKRWLGETTILATLMCFAQLNNKLFSNALMNLLKKVSISFHT